jgi:predicted secreted protein
MKNKAFFILTIFISLFAVVFTFSSCKSTSTEELWYNYSDNSVYVTLDANYTTGYEWTVTIDGASVQLKEEAYTPHDAPSGMVGVGGTWSCTLEAICDGDATVNFTYSRPWDKTDIAETRTLQISVRNSKINSVQEVVE